VTFWSGKPEGLQATGKWNDESAPRKKSVKFLKKQGLSVLLFIILVSKI